MYFVYALKSEVKDWIYVGMTDNLDRRLHEHNSGFNKSTKPYRPFKLIYSEQHPDRVTARCREKYLKSTSGKRYIRKCL